jgi:hypothetical protein
MGLAAKLIMTFWVEILDRSLPLLLSNYVTAAFDLGAISGRQPSASKTVGKTFGR